MSLSSKLARSLSGFDDRKSLRYRLRTRRLQALMRMIESVHQQQGSVSIIDIGGTRRYWNLLPDDFLDRNNVRITIVNLPGSDLPDAEGRFSYVEGDGCDLRGIGNASFDIAHSNSVVEHVGDWGRMRRFAGEVKRVARRHYVQTPSFWFPVEPHCMTPVFHWLPKPWRVALVMRFALGHWARAANVDEAVEIVESARLLDRKMFGALFPDESIQTERMLLWPKSYSVLRDRPALPAADVTVTSRPAR
jgi:hypothetical protein